MSNMPPHIFLMPCDFGNILHFPCRPLHVAWVRTDIISITNHYRDTMNLLFLFCVLWSNNHKHVLLCTHQTLQFSSINVHCFTKTDNIQGKQDLYGYSFNIKHFKMNIQWADLFINDLSVNPKMQKQCLNTVLSYHTCHIMSWFLLLMFSLACSSEG